MIWLLVVACTAAPPPAPVPVAPASPAPADPVSARAPLPEGWLEAVVGTDDATAELPMVVMVHGLGDRPESMLSLLRGFPGPARLIAPRGPAPYSRGFTWFAERSTGDHGVLADQMVEAADRFVADLEQVQAARPTQGKPVLAGFSQGGMMSFTVAVRHPDAIAKAVPVAGWMPDSLWPTSGPPGGAPPVVALHGTADDRLPLAPTRAGVDGMRGRGWSVELQTFDGVGHSIPAPVRDALFTELLEGI